MIKKFFIPFFHGVFCTLILFFLMMSNYEDGLFDQIVKNAVKKNSANIELTDKKKALVLLDTTYNLLIASEKLFLETQRINLRDTLFRSYDVDLLEAKGGCGSFSFVLAKLLKTSGIKSRIGQMKCGEEWGCHMIVEANIEDDWVVLDPTYNLYFTKQNNQLATFKDLNKNFIKFKPQVSSDYPALYKYEDIRYTNWDKVPIIFNILKNTLSFFLSEEEVNGISLRLFIMNIYKIFLIFTFIIYFIFFIFTLRFNKYF